MTMLPVRRLWPLALVLLIACTSRQTPPAQLAPDVLYQRGMAAYEAGEYKQAAELLDVFVQRQLGDPRIPAARMALARAQIEREEYLLAAGSFQRVVSDFPADPLAREARLGLCEAYARLAPKPPLDQEYTRVAVAHCESVSTLYPQMPEGERARELITELRGKLATKAFETGVFYFRRGAYDSAVIYLTDVIDRFPETPVAPAALLKLMESYARIGYEEEEQAARDRLFRDYPESSEARGLRDLG